MQKQPQHQQKRVKTKVSSTGNIRIIAGKHRGRKLPVIMADGLRPTTDRIKETVFNWLMPYVHGSICLDCFSGAGSLGFEAYSRGAKSVTLLELNKTASQQLNANKQLLKADNVEVVNTDSLVYLQTPIQQYNLVFIDPPFRKNLATKTVQLLNNGWLTENAIVYIELEKELSNFALPEHWLLLKEKTAGQVSCRLYQVKAAE